MGIHIKPNDAATKEFFVPVTYASDLTNNNSFPCGFIDAIGEQAWISFLIPADFSSLTSAELIALAGAGNGTSKMYIDPYAQYGVDGEAYSTHNEGSGAIASEANVTDGAFCKWDISGVLSSLVAGDRVGVRVLHNGTALTTDASILGVRLKYS